MLIREDGAAWTAIGQPAHAWLAAQVAAAWAPAPAPDVLLGVAQHDVVWGEWDRRPPLHEGRAASFLEAPVDERLALWSGAADRVVAQSPYAALLVSLHATNIHTRYGAPPPAAAPLLAEQRATQDALLARLGVTREDAERDAELVFCADAISLTLCHGWPDRDLPLGLRLVWLDAEPPTATLRPWPLRADAIEVGLHARRFAERFADAPALHAALDAAPWIALRWRLRRA